MSDSKWRKYVDTDPFSDIKPSLLNSDDIHRYASKGILIEDFDEERLLPAGYQFRFLGKLIYWKPGANKKLERVELDVTKDAPIMLPANSIAYLHMQDEFRMPQYIAARFNLRITHVHQGLLLGTGPIVDPGFWGRILVPLHNLTDNDYAFMGGDSLIHVEFTKLSPLERWNADTNSAEAQDKYKEFPKRKIVETPDYYFKKAGVLANGGVVSNLNPALQEVNAALEEVNMLHEKIKTQMSRFRNIGIGAALATAIALVGLLYNGFNLVQSTNKVLQGVNDTAHQAQSTVVEVRTLLDSDKANENSLDEELERQPDTNADSIIDNQSADGVSQQPERIEGQETESSSTGGEAASPNEPTKGTNQRHLPESQ